MSTGQSLKKQLKQNDLVADACAWPIPSLRRRKRRPACHAQLKDQAVLLQLMRHVIPTMPSALLTPGLLPAVSIPCRGFIE